MISPDSVAEIGVCQICGAPLHRNEATRSCDECQSVFHDDCWTYIGGCATYGCPRMYETKKAEDGPAVFWGASEKTCPMCAEMIAVADKKCPHCGTEFNDIKPVSRSELLHVDREEEDPLHRTALKLLIFSALGLPSPFILIGGGIWYYRRRHEIVAQSPATRGLIVIALSVSAIYMVLIALGLAAFQLSNGGSGGAP
jgi:hypothetical protein